MLATTRSTRLVLAAGLAAWIAAAVAIWLEAAPLGHDEAQYAIAAKDVIEGGYERWFYLSKGMSYLAVPGVLAGGSELALRLIPLVFGVGFVLAVWAVARRACGDETAAWTVAALAAARPYLRHAADLLSDMPAAACLLAATAVILGELRRTEGEGGEAGEGSGVGGVSWRAVLVAPLLAAAFYLRYASCVPIAFLGGAWLVLGWRGIARRPAPVLVAAALFLLLLVPHAVAAIRLTGSPLGILLESSQVVPNAYVGQGLVTYLASNPIAFYGVLMPPILVTGLVAAPVLAWRARDRAAGLLWLAAVPSIIVLALITEAQARYIFFGTALLAILGVDALRRALGRAPLGARRALGAAAAASLVATWAFVLAGQLRHGERRARSHAPTLRAAAAIRADAAGRVCRFLGQQYTQLDWYGGCRSAEAVGYPPPGVLLYVVRTTTGGWQPEVSGDPARHTVILDVPGVVHVERIGYPLR